MGSTFAKYNKYNDKSYIGLKSQAFVFLKKWVAFEGTCGKKLLCQNNCNFNC